MWRFKVDDGGERKKDVGDAPLINETDCGCGPCRFRETTIVSVMPRFTRGPCAINDAQNHSTWPRVVLIHVDLAEIREA